MAEQQIGSLVVIGEGEIIGILTACDYASKVGPNQNYSLDTCIEDVITINLIINTQTNWENSAWSL
jgi:signal-transduction protein with cAMP-binding, CBS, and nucleotidyltransferase domain